MFEVDRPAIQAVLEGRLAASVQELPPPGTPRPVHGTTRLPGKATALIGTRRAGKTTLLHQWRREHHAAGAPLQLLPYLNLEDERIAGLDTADLGRAVDAYYVRLGEVSPQVHVMWSFDEIQVVPDWERLIRRLLDSQPVEVCLTGSSATLLSRQLATAMRGRAWTVVLHPFSFPEFLAHGGRSAPNIGEGVSTANRWTLEQSFSDYLIAGGFPEAQGLTSADRRQLLSDYVDVAMFRDVVERHNVRNIVALRWLVRHLLGNAGGTFSVEKFDRALQSQGVTVAKDTVHEMLAHLEDCFLVRTVWMDADSERQRMVNPRKSYPIDPALISIYDRSDRPNLGHRLETVVMLELERRRAEIAYVRTRSGFEVDFIARFPDGRIELVQVCADATGLAFPRELRALEEARERYPHAQARLLTATAAGLPDEVPSGVRAQPAYEWLLTRDDERD